MRELDSRSHPRISPIQTSSVHRGVAKGLGAHLNYITCQGVRDKTRVPTPHKLSRDEGCHFTFQFPSSFQCPGAYINKMGGHGPGPSGRRPIHCSLLLSHSTTYEHDCRRPVLGLTNPSRCVVSPSKHCQSCLQPMGSPKPRHLCNKVQHKVSNFCVTYPRHQGIR